MKLKALALSLILMSPLAQATTLPDNTIGCPQLHDLQELLTAVVNQDLRLFTYKFEDGCFPLEDGLEYSVLDESYGDHATSWVEIKVYKGGETYDLYVYKLHLNK